MSAATQYVLIVDDSPVLRELMTHYLDDEADLAVVAAVASGPEAVARVEQLAPDVVLLDHEMPGRTGLQVLPELRRRCPDARIVVFSADGDVGARALASGADLFVGKDRGFHEVAQALRGS